MELFLIIFAGGAVVVAWLYLWSRQRQRLGTLPDMETLLSESRLSASGDAILVAAPGGKLLYSNMLARSWAKLDDVDPDLEMLARLAQPSDSFLELFAHDGQAAFQFGGRWVEAASHRIPAGEETRIIVTLRELAAQPSAHSAAPAGAVTGLDLGSAISIVNEIGETINASLGIERVLAGLLTIVRRAIPSDAGEICLYEETQKLLIPRGWDGDSVYVLKLAEEGGYYDLGEGISGWIAQFRKPVLVTDALADGVVRPKIANNPYRSFIAVPLVMSEPGGTRFLGTFELASAEAGRFTPTDLTLLNAIARPLATTIYNTQLYTAQAQRIEELATLQSLAVSSGDSPDRLYASLSERIARLMDAGMCGFLLYDAKRSSLIAEPPFYGLPTQLVRGYSIPVAPETPGADLWEDADFWISNDLSDEPNLDALGMRRLVNPGGVENTALIPLMVGGRRIGIVQVGNRRTRGGFSTIDMQQFRLLAGQAAVAVEEIRLAQEEARRDAEMAGLQELAQSFGELTTEGEFLAVTTERIARLMDVPFCGVLLYDEANYRLRAQPPFYGLADELIALYEIDLEPGSPISQIWDESDWWYTNNVATDIVVLTAGLGDLAAALSITRTMLVIMTVGGRRLGTIQISNKRSGDFNDEDARLLLIFAAQVGGMIENNRLFQETQRRAEEAERLRVLAERASAILTAEDNMQPVLEEIARLMDSPAVFINVLDAQAGTLTTYPRYIYGVAMDEPLVQDTYSKGFEYSVALSRRHYLSNDVPNDPMVLPTYRAAAEKMSIVSAVLVPLNVGELALGELGVMNRREPPYSDADRVLLAQIAIQISGALDRIRLYAATGENLRRRLAELDAINRVSNEIAQTLDVEHVLEVIRLEAVRATEATGSTVVLFKQPDRWHNPDMPDIDKRLGERRPTSGVADIELAATRRIDAVLVDDYQAADAEVKPPGLAARSAVATAILYEERPVGVIHLYHDQPHHFDSRAATFLMTLAAKASLSYGGLQRYLENQERSDRLRRRVEQLNQIFELGQMLQTGVETTTMLEALAYSVQQSAGFDVVVMTLVDEAAGVLRRETHAGLPIETFERTQYKVMSLTTLDHLFAKDEYLISETLFLPFERVGQWYIEGMDALSPHFEGNRTLHPAGKGDWRDGDMLLVPITGPTGERLGVMSLDRPFNGQRPDRSVIEILEIFAHQAAATIENTRLFYSSVRTAEQEARLNEIIESISHTLNPDAIIESGARGIARLLAFNRLTVALLDTENVGYDVTRVTLQTGGTMVVGRDHRDTLDSTALGRAYRTGEDALYLDNDSPTDEVAQNQDPYRDYEDLYSLRLLGERTTLVLPLVTGGFVLGAMHIGSDQLDEDSFDELRPLLQRIANLLAVAIQNARLFNQAVNLRLFNESVVQSIQQGIIVMDVGGAILTINEFMRRRFKWGDAALGRWLFAYRPDLEPILSEALVAMLETGSPQELIAREIVEDGERLILNFYLYPLFSADSPRGGVLLLEDITYRATLEANLEQRARQLAALTEVSSRITAQLRREEVITLALDEMARIISYDSMSIWLRDGAYLACHGGRGDPLPPDHARIAIEDDEHLLALIGTRRPVNIGDVARLRPSPIRPSSGSWLAVELIEEGRIVGVIALGKRETNSYDSYAEQGAQAFANQVAVALVNAALFEDAQIRTQRLSLLNRVSISLARSLDTENILEIALNEIAQALGFTNGRAYLIERDANVARAVVETPRGDIPPTQDYDLTSHYGFAQIVNEAQPFLLPDVQAVIDGTVDAPPPLVELARSLARRGVRSLALLPMTVSGQLTGAFEIEACDQVRTYYPERIDLVLIIANQAGIAVMNSNLLEQTLVRTRELETLLEAAQSTSNTLDLDEVFRSVIRLLLQALDMDDCAIMLYDNVQGSLTVQLDLNRLGETEREMLPGTIFDLKLYPAKRRAVEEGQIVVVRAEDHNADPAEAADMATTGETARMLVPLMVREQPIGLLQIELRSRYRTFTHREIRLAQALGAQAATSIENARLSTETSAQVEQSLILNELARAVSSTMDISDMLRIVRDQVPQMMDADTMYVALFNSETSDIVFPMAVKNGADIFIPPRVMGNDEVSYIIRQRRPLSLGGDNPSAEMVRRNFRIDNGEGDALRYLGVPLIAGDQVVGVLALRDSRKSRPFGLNDQRILTTIGTQLGAAIQNANLFERVRNFADELNLRVQERTRELQEERDRIEALYQITSELGSTLDMDRLLRGALENVARVVGADDAAVLLINPLTDHLFTRSSLLPSSSDSVLSGAGAPVADAGTPVGESAHHPAEMLAGWLTSQSGERAIRVDDLVMTPYWNLDAPGAEEYRSAIAVVLETQDDSQGAMIFLGRDAGQFTEPQLRLVQAAASQVATAINNADLYNLIRDQAERMVTLLRAEQEEAEKNSAILEGIADGVLLVDAAGVIVLFNDAAERILDVTRDFALGQPLSRLAALSEGSGRWVSALNGWIARHGVDRRFIEANVEDTPVKGASLISAVRAAVGDKRPGDEESLVVDRLEVGQRVVSIRAASVYVADQLLGTVAVLRDVTKEVEVERMKSDFIANVTHELRTPLTSIVGYIDFMLMGGAGKLEEQPLRFLGTIKNNAERLRNLVEDLLSISELDSGRGKLNVEELDLEDLIMTVVGHLASVFGQQGKQFDVVTDVARDLSIQGDRVKVTQIISNIVENAFSYTYSGGKVTIMANMQPDQRHVLISIADTGIGIPEEFRSRIWNRFERYEEHALVMDVAGTGLGLPIVKTLVEMHGGEVWLESEVNRGTTFFVRLPLVPPPSVAGDGLAILAAAPTSTQTAPPPASGSREAAAERGGNGYTTEHAEAGTVEEG